MSRSQQFAAWVLAHRRWVAIGLVVASLVAALGIWDPFRGLPRLRIDPSLNEMLPTDDPSRIFYEELLTRFGSDDRVLVALRSKQLFSPDGLATLTETAEVLARMDGVMRVEGLPTAIQMRRVDDDLEIAGLLEEEITTQVEADRLRDELLSDPLRAGSFVSADGESTALIVTFDRIPEDEFLARGLDLEVLRAAREAAPEMRVVMAGTPHVKAEVGRLLTAELGLMVPFVFVLMSTISCLFFRSVRVGMVPIAAVALGLLWTVGVMGWVGHDLNIVTTLIPPLVLALGFAYAAHVVADFSADHDLGSEVTARVRAERALAHVLFPVCLTALTTAAGFLSLATNGLQVVRGFGIFAAVSTAATLLAALTLVPLLLSVGKGRSNPNEAQSSSEWLDRLFRRIAVFDIRFATPILVVAGIVCGLAALAATRIEVNLPVIENFSEDAEIRRAYEEVDRQFGGANQFYVMLRANEKGAFEQPAWLREIESLETWLRAQPEIGGTLSVVQYIKVLNEALGPESTPAGRIPDSENLIAQLLLFGANEELDVLLDRAHQVATILVRSTETETREFNALGRRIDQRLAQLPDGVEANTTGNAILLTRAADRIATGQAISLLLACGIIGLMLVLYFKSLRLGLFALIPNLVPVLLYFGLLGATGITLNNSTALMGSIVLGVAVDDTLHLLVEYRRALASTGDAEEAIRRALAQVGRAISCTTLAVCVGLLVVGGSGLRNQAEFGLLGAATLAIAWWVDVTVTPALCLRLLGTSRAR